MTRNNKKNLSSVKLPDNHFREFDVGKTRIQILVIKASYLTMQKKKDNLRKQ